MPPRARASAHRAGSERMTAGTAAAGRRWASRHAVAVRCPTEDQMRHTTTARAQAAKRPRPNVRVLAGQGTAGWSATQWRSVVECLAEAYTYYERRLDDLREETVERFCRSLE